MGRPAVHVERILHPVSKDQARSGDIVVAMGESQHESARRGSRDAAGRLLASLDLTVAA